MGLDGLLPEGASTTGFILWFAATPWDELKRSDRHLVEQTTRPVVWIDATRSPVRRGGRRLPARWGGVRVEREEPLIVRVTPATVPLATRPGVRLASSPLKRLQVRSVLKALGVGEPSAVVVSSLVDAGGAWGKETIEILRGSDDYVAGAELLGVSARRLRRLEKRALERADVVVAVTDRLAEKWRGLGANPVVVPNGCSPIAVKDLTRQRRAKAPQSPPKVGLVGYLNARIDIRFLEAIQSAGMHLVLIGPVDPRWEPKRFTALTGRHNVDYRGRLPAAEIPRILRQIDVGITPYTDSDFKRASSPLKTLEYLASGIPVVTSDLPAARRLESEMIGHFGLATVPQHLAFAHSADEFVDAIRALARARSTMLDSERWRFACTQSWRQRAAQLEVIVAASSTQG